MKKYHVNLDELQQFTLQLNYQNEICPHCQESGQLLSHGFVYKKNRQGNKMKTGKRVFCSNRHGKHGCGRTIQLYLAESIPHLQYDVFDLYTFLSALFAAFSIRNAYKLTTSPKNEPRHAYRWLSKITRKLSEFRTAIKKHSRDSFNKFQSRSERFRMILPTLHTLFSQLGSSPVCEYQLRNQKRFI